MDGAGEFGEELGCDYQSASLDLVDQFPAEGRHGLFDLGFEFFDFGETFQARVGDLVDDFTDCLLVDVAGIGQGGQLGESFLGAYPSQPGRSFGVDFGN